MKKLRAIFFFHFEHPQSFNKIFKKKTNLSQLDFSEILI